MPARTSRRLCLALALLLAAAALPLSGAAEASTVPLPAAYLASRVGGFPAGIEPRLRHLPGVRHAAVVLENVAWMTRSVAANGTVIGLPPPPLAIPLDVMAAGAWTMAPFLPAKYRTEVAKAMAAGRAVLGTRSAHLRRLHVGDRLVFRGGVSVTVGAVVPDPVASWSEVLVSRAVAARIGVHSAKFALLAVDGKPTVPVMAWRIRALLPAGFPVRVRRPGTARFRRTSDTGWPPVLMKLAFGEFAARPEPGRPGYLQMGAAFIRDHLATESVPLLGRFTCNRRLFAPLRAAMNDLRRRGLAGLVHSFSGCYNSRMVMRQPTWAISKHTWGAAVDINAPENPWSRTPHQDGRLVRVMEAHGFTWGGDWIVPDGMHFEYEGVKGIAPV